MPALDLAGPGLFLVTGVSGAGKTSLLKALTGTLGEFQGGDVRGTVAVDDGTGRSPKIGYVPQDARDAFLAHDPLTEIQLRLQARGWKYHAARDEAMVILRGCRLDDRARVPLHRLSAGERRRLALVAARLHRPDLILLDEPLNHLDDAWRTTLINEVSAMAETSLVLLATHEPDPWLPVATQRIHVEAGRATTESTEPFPREDLWDREDVKPGGPELIASDVEDARNLFSHVELRLGRGLHAIAGPNGSGKSTLLRILGGLEPTTTGTVAFDDRDLRELGPPALARFRAHHIEEPRETFFLETSADEIRFQPNNAGVPKDQTDERASEAANAFALGDITERHPLSLSGGEQERVALACTHASRADLILLDEPTHGLDEQGRASLLAFLAESSRRACVVLATHDERLLALCDTVHRFAERRLIPVRGAGIRSLVEVHPRAR